jgi:hypothetical protein
MPEAGDQSRRAGRPGTVVLVALVLAACAFAYAISVAWADDGGSGAASSQGAPAAQPVQQNDDRPRDDCPERDGEGGSSGSSGSSDSGLQY